MDMMDTAIRSVPSSKAYISIDITFVSKIDSRKKNKVAIRETKEAKYYAKIQVYSILKRKGVCRYGGVYGGKKKAIQTEEN